MSQTYVFIGGFEHETFSSNMALVSAEFDEGTGILKSIEAYPNGLNYGFICRNHAGTCLYAVDTRPDSGKVASYIIQPKGKLKFQSELTIEGAALGLHCAVSINDRFLIAAFGNSSTVYACSLKDDGSLDEVVDKFTAPKGTATIPRQESGPAPHQVFFDRSGKYLIVPDIHTDRLYSLSFDLATGKMTEQDYVTVDGGEGPRHVAIHPSNRWIYLLNEMGASVYFFEFNDKTGKITRKQDVALVPRSYLKKQKPDAVLSSEIVISPDGRFVLASMRGYFDKNGEDRIYVITIDENIGEMIEVRSFSCGGVCPRTIDFSPSGRFLLVGNKFSDEFVSIRYDDETGKLQGICGRIPAVDNATFCCV